eukprot:CAMPEP_0183764632 /NCGR_PEP_ID=MMETSP0739-20130205/10425_1 /TAXON_ID=385413 /ORGANISM="Thalassiosira miniscula, Strain CCMP1093" /LENGTH=49 /DNA_ID=CAMNT_0026003193 /DNA_START=27 /DNA_END=176 /DNA_ORIENTATION=-
MTIGLELHRTLVHLQQAWPLVPLQCSQDSGLLLRLTNLNQVAYNLEAVL